LFVDRKAELDWLEEKWRSGKPELILVYGRRRIGKTRLLQEWMKGKEAFYFIAEEIPEKPLLERLSMELAEFTGDELLAERPFTSWRQLFIYLAQISRNKRLAFILDEFQYAAKEAPGLLSQLQSIWDTKLSRSKIMLVLMGSIVSFTEGVLSEKNPLYGRITGALKLHQLNPLQARCFTPNYRPEDALGTYGVFGGVPGYLEQVDPGKPLWDNIRSLILSPNSRYLDEAKYLLKEELRDVTRYYAILEAVAGGATRFGDIASKTGIPGESLPKYLGTLESMGLLERRKPVLPGGKPVYRIRDRFLRFWFRYIPRYRAAIELGYTDKVASTVKEDFEAIILPEVWEETLQHLVTTSPYREKLGVTPTRIGSWWSKNIEIDLVALDETRKPPLLLVGEAKWTRLTTRQARRILDRLRGKTSSLPVDPAEVKYVLAAKHVEPNTHLLPGEHIITLEDYDKASLTQCRPVNHISQ